MKLFRKLTLVLLTGLAFISCQKEYSQENGGAGAGDATGTLKADGTGECLPSSVQGIFIVGTAVNTSNYINVDVDITTLGTYTIVTDVKSGISFSATGVATTTGVQTIKLTANASGIPTTAGATTFTVTFGSSQCNIVVDIYPAGTGNAVITAVDCSAFILGGTYTQGTAVTSSNTVQVQVTVATAGLYNITTDTQNGVVFSGNGFLAAGTPTITLTANGAPGNAGMFTYTITAGTNTCAFDVTYAAGPPVGAGLLNCKINGVASTFNTNTSAILDNSTGFPILSIEGQTSAAAEPFLTLGIIRTTGTIANNTTYTANQLANGVLISCSYRNATAVDYAGGSDPLNQSQNPGFQIKITTITATRVIGTFSGQIKDNGGSGPGALTITEGNFNIPF